jgi:Na+-transporting NADH:ubiquinone oxidoreductase subunit NqrE
VSKKLDSAVECPSPSFRHDDRDGRHLAHPDLPSRQKRLGYLQTVVFILVIAALVQLVEIILKRMSGPSQIAGVYLPLITTNCAFLA